MFEYPPARKDDVVDDYHGTPVADPYRWMEDPADSEVVDWGEAQSTLAIDFLRELSMREAMRDRLTTLWNTPRQSPPTHRQGRYFFFKNDGLQDQPEMRLSDKLDGDSRPVIDPNTFSDDGTVALSNYALSKDGRLLAYATSSGGTDWQSVRIHDVDGGTESDETLEWMRFTGIAWTPDSAGFYYSRYPETGDREDSASTLHNKVYYHHVGTPQSDDVLVYERPDEPTFGFSPVVSDQGDYLWLYVWHAAINRNRIYYRPLDSDGDFIRLIDEPDAEYSPLGVIDGVMFVETDKDAPRGRVIAYDLAQPDASPREIVPEGDDAIGMSTIAGGQIVIVYLHNAHHQIKTFNLDGSPLMQLTLPDMGKVLEWQSQHDHHELFVSFESYLYAPSVFRFDLESGERTTLFRSETTVDTEQFAATQVFYPSKDGTQVSMFLVHRKDIDLNGENPTLLYAYGGFSIPILPTYEPQILNWVDQGGVYAVANLRGGSEYGEAWHQGGMLENKQNVFDDFISAGEWLVAQKYTRPGKLGIMGRSNGGLLVAAVMLQRPDLFGAVICNVPVTDMLRYHRFTAGRYWTAEYGNAEENADHFAFLYKYSPVHNVKDGESFPATLILSADLDDRVVPMHAKKFAAALQHAQAGDRPIILRLDTRSGHGHGKPTSKWIEEWADIHAFLMQHLV